MNDQQIFIRGFNSGYLLAKYLPELLTKLLESIHASSPYVQGLSFGQKEFELEHSQRELETLKNIRAQNHSKGLDRDL